MALFDPDFLSRIEYLALVAKRMFQGQFLAQRRTRQLGTGIEFADHREYVAGDDFRYLDWNLYARHDELLLKRFQEEEDLHVYIFVDCSRSMGIGDPSKFDYARRVAAALAYMALANLDRVAILGVADGLADELPLTRGKSRILSLLHFLEAMPLRDADTNLEAAIQAFVNRRPRRGLAVVISDLFDPHGYERGVGLLRHYKFEPHVVQPLDRNETAPELLGDLELIDVETGAGRKVTVTEANLRQYRELMDHFLEGVAEHCKHYGLGLSRTYTDVPFDEFLLRMMRASGVVA